MPEAGAPGPVVAHRLLIVGRVQGVGYRASAATEALRLGLAGWVRNRFDSSVEALVAGPQATVEQFITWARRGPRAARVDHVEISAAEAPADDTFRVLPSA
ncbi:acylphosphatase [Pseudothauera rhizosphaerae]|uniref:acylphosphatase n=1 Tax=Pseudothauera rhizosphaerae TaxID=2565932 RepID=A0A4S4APK4_9RHOO|nr:acylphosphatase [Pseudothauera rhizosphaerae]THF61561.1 acylphosphatase [Pseudothauera rhizosphaerae]